LEDKSSNKAAESGQEQLETVVVSDADALRRLEVKNGELERLLAEKDERRQQEYHRIKNNLQMVSSLLRMQAELLKGRDERVFIEDGYYRVLAIAMIHERLYMTEEADRVDFEEYTHALVAELFNPYEDYVSNVSKRIRTSPVYLATDQAIPCSIILNELVSNALRHAYPNGQTGEITIALAESLDGRVTLTVSDKGVGLPVGWDLSELQTMGVPIVDLLAKQLGGSLRWRSERGTEFTVEFPKVR